MTWSLALRDTQQILNLLLICGLLRSLALEVSFLLIGLVLKLFSSPFFLLEDPTRSGTTSCWVSVSFPMLTLTFIDAFALIATDFLGASALSSYLHHGNSLLAIRQVTSSRPTCWDPVPSFLHQQQLCGRVRLASPTSPTMILPVLIKLYH